MRTFINNHIRQELALKTIEEYGNNLYLLFSKEAVRTSANNNDSSNIIVNDLGNKLLAIKLDPKIAIRKDDYSGEAEADEIKIANVDYLYGDNLDGVDIADGYWDSVFCSILELDLSENLTSAITYNEVSVVYIDEETAPIITDFDSINPDILLSLARPGDTTIAETEDSFEFSVLLRY